MAGYLRLLERGGYVIGEGFSDHHRKLVHMHLTHADSANFSGIGCDKKLPVIETIRVLLDLEIGKRCLIITPAAGITYWNDRLQACGLPPEHIISLRGGKPSKKKKALVESKPGQVFLTSYSSMSQSSWRVYGDELSLADIIRDQQWDIVVADEVHRIKNPDTKRSELCYELADKARYRIALGYAFINSLVDVWGVFRFIDSSVFGTNYNKFLNAFFVQAEDGKPWSRWIAKVGVEKLLLTKIKELPNISLRF